MLPDCRCYLNSFAQWFLGAPDVKNGLQAGFRVAKATDCTDWERSLAKALLDALSHIETMAHIKQAGDIEGLVHAMERSKDCLVKDLVLWTDPTHRYVGLCFVV